jgi:hypothetical protein
MSVCVREYVCVYMCVKREREYVCMYICDSLIPTHAPLQDGTHDPDATQSMLKRFEAEEKATNTLVQVQ